MLTPRNPGNLWCQSLHRKTSVQASPPSPSLPFYTSVNSVPNPKSHLTFLPPLLHIQFEMLFLALLPIVSQHTVDSLLDASVASGLDKGMYSRLYYKLTYSTTFPKSTIWRPSVTSIRVALLRIANDGLKTPSRSLNMQEASQSMLWPQTTKFSLKGTTIDKV